MTHENDFEITEDENDAVIEDLSEKVWPVTSSERSNTGSPIDNIINYPRFMVSAIHGIPCTPRSPEQRAADAIRRDKALAKMERAVAFQRERISRLQSRGDIRFYNGSAANDNTPMQSAVA